LDELAGDEGGVGGGEQLLVGEQIAEDVAHQVVSLAATSR
jgi:hypothetical protein